jgi:hypothetical protein
MTNSSKLQYEIRRDVVVHHAGDQEIREYHYHEEYNIPKTNSVLERINKNLSLRFPIVYEKTNITNSGEGKTHNRYDLLKTVTPGWAQKAEIKKFYELAKKLTEETGIIHHVDHIIPLNHPLVCGLHVKENLQVITREENYRKSNTFIVE